MGGLNLPDWAWSLYYRCYVTIRININWTHRSNNSREPTDFEDIVETLSMRTHTLGIGDHCVDCTILVARLYPSRTFDHSRSESGT